MTASPTPGPVSAAVQLARAAAAGDTAATRRLVEDLAPRMLRTVQMALGFSHPDVHDVLQLSLLGLIQALPSFRGDCQPAHFASRIAMRAAIAARKRARLHAGRHDADAELDAVVCAEPLPSESAGAARRRAVLRELLEELPEEQAESLALRVILGWTLEEVADATSAPLNTVRSRIRLAKVALRRRIEADPRLTDDLA